MHHIKLHTARSILLESPTHNTQYSVHAGSSGSVSFVDVPQRDENNRVYNLRVVGKTADGVRTVIRRRVRVGERQVYTFVILHWQGSAYLEEAGGNLKLPPPPPPARFSHKEFANEL